MMLRLSLLCAAIILAEKAPGQGRDTATGNAGPVGGVSELTNRFKGIQFTKVQREIFKDAEIDFVFRVDGNGGAILMNIKGVTDPGVLDSLYHRAQNLPPFYPMMQNGVPVSSVYVMTIRSTLAQPLAMQDNPDTTARVVINTSTREVKYRNRELLFAIAGNTFLGSASEYLQPGLGAKLDYMVTGRKFSIGFVMEMFANSRKKAYPIVTARPQESTIPTVLIGLSGGTTFLESSTGELNVQIEIHYLLQNVVGREYDNDPDYVQFRGFSPGIVANYLLPIGKIKSVTLTNGTKLINHQYLNFHLALRNLYYSNQAASGFMMEVGVGYRYRTRGTR